MIVIFGTERDEHVSSVAHKLTQNRVPTVVLDYLEKTPVTFLMDKSGRHQLNIDDLSTPQETLLWDRTKLGLPGFSVEGEPRSAAFETREWHAIYTLLAGVFANRTVNSLESRRCMVKPYQQLLASKCGFLVPPTLVTNAMEAVQRFLAKESRLVVKTLSGAKISPKPTENPIPYNIMTLPVDQDALRRASSESIARCPHFFQRNITKSFELRVVAVGDAFFAFKIHSQTFASSSQDWRRALPWLNFEPIVLPGEIAERVRAFLDVAGLFTGSFDLIVDDQDQCWFLECNQDGQWSWLDSIVDGQISSAFAEALAGRMACC